MCHLDTYNNAYSLRYSRSGLYIYNMLTIYACFTCKWYTYSTSACFIACLHFKYQHVMTSFKTNKQTVISVILVNTKTKCCHTNITSCFVYTERTYGLFKTKAPMSHCMYIDCIYLEQHKLWRTYDQKLSSIDENKIN